MSVLENIELDTIIANTRKIAAENPDFIYQHRKFGLQENRCDYERDGKASCLIAKALFAAGVPVEELIEFDQRSSGDIGTILVYPNDVYDDEYNLLPSRFEYDEENLKKVNWISHVQQCQDAGYTWSNAVKSADQYLSLAA